MRPKKCLLREQISCEEGAETNRRPLLNISKDTGLRLSFHTVYIMTDGIRVQCLQQTNIPLHIQSLNIFYVKALLDDVITPQSAKELNIYEINSIFFVGDRK